jgi:hypothetical protein
MGMSQGTVRITQHAGSHFFGRPHFIMFYGRSQSTEGYIGCKQRLKVAVGCFRVAPDPFGKPCILPNLRGVSWLSPSWKRIQFAFMPFCGDPKIPRWRETSE